MDTGASSFRFGPFEARARTRELFKHGVRLKIRPQPFLVLTTLLGRPRDVVTRDELRQLLWSTETFVDFEHSLNTSIKELRAVLGDSASQPRYIETLPRLGYRFIGSLEAVQTPPAAAATAAVASSSEATASEAGAEVAGSQAVFEPALVPVAAKPATKIPWRWVAVVVPVAASLAVIGAYELSRSHFRLPPLPRPGADERRMLAVLPFENLTGDPDQEYFSDGLTEEMITQLATVDPQHLGVVGRTSVMHYKHTQESLDRIGDELGVQYVLEGSVRRDSRNVRIAAQLIQVKDQTHLWAREYDRELSNLLVLQSEIAREIGDEIQTTIGGSSSRTAVRRPIPAPQTTSSEAYDLYLRGRYLWNKRTESALHQAADYFQEAIDKDPNYARAYAGLADSLALLSTWDYVPAREFMPKARAAALKALQIDESLAEAHTSLALIAEQYDYDWQTAEKEFHRALQLDPNYATARQWLAECLGFQARFDEAFAESERARQLDPLSLIIASDHAVLLYYSRQYDRAIEQFRAVQAMEQDFPRSGSISTAYIETGTFAEALAATADFARRTHQQNDPGILAGEAYVYGRWGRQSDAQRTFAKFEKQCRLQASGRCPPWAFVQAYLAVGRKDDAIATLQKTYSENGTGLAELKVGPVYDPLRSDSRFQNLLRLTHLD